MAKTSILDVPEFARLCLVPNDNYAIRWAAEQEDLERLECLL